MRKSTRLFLIGEVLVFAGAGLFWWSMSTDLHPSTDLASAEFMAELGRYGGGIFGAGIAFGVAALYLRLRGN